MRDDAPDEPYYGSVAAWTHAHVDDRGTPAPAPERYELGGELGRGGMGVVQAATDVWLGRTIAVKRPHHDLSDGLRHRLMREASITSQLVHPSIVPVYDVGQDEHGTYYTMPVLVGNSLEERLFRKADTVTTLVRALARVTRAVAYAHSHDIVHRDLKPANILLGDFGEVWLLDWGVAQDAESRGGEYVGTLGFQSPEQEAGYTVDGRADVFSLGRVLHEILDSESTDVPELRTIARTATEPDADKRYQTAEALAGDLERWLDGRRVSVHAYTATEVLWRFVRRHHAPLAVAALSAVILSLVVVIAFRTQRAERDRAILAEQKSEQARLAADAHLSVSLRQQASSMAAKGARQQAEILAIQSLELAESPLARGVLMAWEGTPRPQFSSQHEQPCAQPFTASNGHQICTKANEVARYDASGALLWRSSASTPVLGKGKWVGDYQSGRLYDDGMLLLRAIHTLEIWRDGNRHHVTSESPAYKLISGPIPAVVDHTRVGKVDLETAQVTWTKPLCERIETAYLSEEHLVVACRKQEVRVGTFADPGPPLPVPNSVSQVTWMDGPILGTFSGALLTRTENGWSVVPSTVEGVRQLLPLEQGYVAVLGERGDGTIWSPQTGAFLTRLPGHIKRMARNGKHLNLIDDDVRTYRLPAGLAPTRFDRSQFGGLRFLNVAPSGKHLVTASPNDELLVWEVASGLATVLSEPNQGISIVSGTFSDNDHVAFSTTPGGFQRIHREGGPWSLLHPAAPKSVRPVAGGAAALGYGGQVQIFGSKLRIIPVEAPPVAMSSGTPTWVANESGRVARVEGDSLVASFTLPEPTGDIANCNDLVIATQGWDVAAFTSEGSEVWRWEGRARLTAMHASNDWVAVGDAEGTLVVISAAGQELARIQGHERLIADVAIVDDVLFSGSWDGTARRWGLRALNEDVDVLAREIREAWGQD